MRGRKAAQGGHHVPVVRYLPADGINPPQRVTLCACGNLRCTRWLEVHR